MGFYKYVFLHHVEIIQYFFTGIRVLVLSFVIKVFIPAD